MVYFYFIDDFSWTFFRSHKHLIFKLTVILVVGSKWIFYTETGWFFFWKSKQVDLEDPVFIGARFVEQVAARINDLSGDGLKYWF